MISIRKVDETNIWDIVGLTVRPDQENFVASNTESILEAYVSITSGIVALPFGLYKDDTLVGFVMFGYGSTDDEDEPQIADGNYCIWRFMIDENHQRHGYGREAVEASIKFLQTEPAGPARYCWLSYEPENTIAQSLYRSMGFKENGEMSGDEVVAVLELNTKAI